MHMGFMRLCMHSGVGTWTLDWNMDWTMDWIMDSNAGLPNEPFTDRNA